MNALRAWIVATALGFLVAMPTMAADPIDCSKIMSKDDKDTFKVAPEDVKSCINRGYDAPKGWRPDEGKSKGVRVVGARGFSYGTISAPESPAGARGANASVSRAAIDRSCNIPPRIRVSTSPPFVNFPKGSCLDFLKNLLKDKDGLARNSPAPTGVPPEDVCPAETDTTGIYGKKISLENGGSHTVPCGGVVPTTTVDLTLNRDPIGMAATETGYRIRYYRKVGNKFILAGNKQLPTFLCKEKKVGLQMKRFKTWDLTATIPQMITYNPGDVEISLRLQPRISMPLHYIPSYADHPSSDMHLIIPITGNGGLSVPKRVDPCDKGDECDDDCPLEKDHLKVPDRGIELILRPSIIKGCTAPPKNLTQVQISVCPDNSAKNPLKPADKKCYDNTTGKPVPKVQIWVPRCSDGKPSPPSGVCPGHPKATPIDCPPGSSESYPDPSCDMTNITPDSESEKCFDPSVGFKKTQYSVLNRPAIYYPPESNPSFYTIEGRTAVMATTVPRTKLFTQSSTVILLNFDGPNVTFNEGGVLKLKNGSLLTMNQGAIIKPTEFVVQMPFGGDLVSSGGTQIRAFAAGEKYKIPSAQQYYPIEIKVTRSTSLPKGYMIPTLPKVDNRPPYLRLPADRPAE